MYEGQKKVAVKVADEKELGELEEAADQLGLPHALIVDRGLTEIPEGTVTCLGIGPAPAGMIDRLTGKLKVALGDFLSVPEIDKLLGIEVYATKTAGVGGAIRESVEDFVVEEVLVDGSKATCELVRFQRGFWVHLFKSSGFCSVFWLSATGTPS